MSNENPLLKEDGRPNLSLALSLQVDTAMEAGFGKDDKGLTKIAAHLNLRFQDVKEYVQAF